MFTRAALIFASITALGLAVHTDAGGLDPAAAWPALRHDRRNTGRGE